MYSPDRILVKLQQDGKEREFSEKDLGKVLPGEGGRVLMVTSGRVATLTHIDLKSSMVTAKIGDSEGNKEVFKLNINDVCKIN